MEAAEDVGDAGSGHSTGHRPEAGAVVELGGVALHPRRHLLPHTPTLAPLFAGGCLPIPVEVTAALFEIRLRDPFFRTGVASDDKLESDEMLALLYSMAIIRCSYLCFLLSQKRKSNSAPRSR